MNEAKLTETLERRENDRIDVRAHCEISTDSGSWYAHLMNISNGGALLAVVDDNSIKLRNPMNLSVEMSEDGSTSFSGVVVHLKKHYVGIAFDPPISENARRELQGFVETKKT